MVYTDYCKYFRILLANFLTKIAAPYPSYAIGLRNRLAVNGLSFPTGQRCSQWEKSAPLQSEKMENQNLESHLEFAENKKSMFRPYQKIDQISRKQLILQRPSIIKRESQQRQMNPHKVFDPSILNRSRSAGERHLKVNVGHSCAGYLQALL